MLLVYVRDSSALRLQIFYEETVYFRNYVPRSNWYTFHRPRKDERLSRPWSYTLVLTLVALDLKSSVLTTRTLLQHGIQRF